MFHYITYELHLQSSGFFKVVDPLIYATSILCNNCAFCDKSTKFGSKVENHNQSGYWATTDLPFGDLAAIFVHKIFLPFVTQAINCKWYIHMTYTNPARTICLYTEKSTAVLMFLGRSDCIYVYIYSVLFT